MDESPLIGGLTAPGQKPQPTLLCSVTTAEAERGKADPLEGKSVSWTSATQEEKKVPF